MHVLSVAQSEEDLALKTSLEAAVAAIQSNDSSTLASSLELIAREIKTATSTMTSVPKPLKFLSPHFDTLVEAFAVRMGCVA